MIEAEKKIGNIFRNGNFLKLWLGQVISCLGDRLVQMAFLGWLISAYSRSGSEMAQITFYSLVPSFVLGGFAGSLADRMSRKWLLILSTFFRAVIILAVYLFLADKQPSILWIYSLITLIGFFAAFFVPARLSIIPNIVHPEDLQAANALTTGAGMIATLLGTFVAGKLIALYGFDKGMLMNALIYIVSAAMLLLIKPSQYLNKEANASKTLKSNGSVKAALNYLKTHKKAWDLILLSVWLSILSSAFYVSLTAVAVDTFKLGMEGVGKLLSMLGIGMIVGSFLSGSLVKKVRPTSLVVVSLFVLFLTTSTAKIVTSYTLAWVWLLLVGIANAIILVTIDTVLQKITPDRFRGKLFGIRSMMTNGVFLLSLLATGALLKMESVFSVFHILAWMSLALAIVILFTYEQLSYLFFRFLTSIVLKTFFSFKVEGVEFLNQKGQVILAGNHTSYLDGPAIVAGFNRPVRFLVSSKVFSWNFIGPIVKRMRIVPVQAGKGKDALEKAGACLKKNEAIVIFPEGRLTRDGKIGPFFKGMARLHQDSRAPIVPFIIHGGFEAWPWMRKLPKRRQITIQFGQPISIADKNDKDILEQVRERVQFMKEALERRDSQWKNPKEYEKSALHLMQLKSDTFGGKTAIFHKEKNKWRSLSYIELSRKARDLSDYLIESGFQKGERIAILSESKPEWAVAFFASIRSGAITVPVDIKLTDAELKSILSDARPRVLFVSEEHVESAIVLKEAIDSIEKVIVLEEKSENTGYPLYSSLRSKTLLEGVQRDASETALIIYTSGTTGNPKGVMISFGNLIFEVRNFEHKLGMGPDDLFLSILPLNHLLELTAGFLGVLHSGGRICYCQSLHPQEIAKAMKEKKSTLMITVPLFLKMLKNSVEKQIRKLKPFEQKMFQVLFAAAKFVPSQNLKRAMFSAIHQQFGGKLRGFVSGGAPLDPEVGEFFERIGIPVYQGYGLSETSPVITANTPGFNRLGSVGRALDGVEIRIATSEDKKEEGEILTRGPHIMQGYYKREDLTKEVIDSEGWFHTGDLGRIDKEGYLYITGRIKNLIVLGGGKKIHPEEVEAVLSNSNLVKEVCVTSTVSKEGLKEGTEEVCAVMVPSDDLLKRFSGDREQIQQEMKKEMDRLNQNLASYKRPTRMFIYPGELPKTATRKIKRPLVNEWLKTQ